MNGGIHTETEAWPVAHRHEPSWEGLLRRRCSLSNRPPAGPKYYFLAKRQHTLRFVEKTARKLKLQVSGYLSCASLALFLSVAIPYSFIWMVGGWREHGLNDDDRQMGRGERVKTRLKSEEWWNSFLTTLSCRRRRCNGWLWPRCQCNRLSSLPSFLPFRTRLSRP